MSRFGGRDKRLLRNILAHRTHESGLEIIFCDFSNLFIYILSEDLIMENSIVLLEEL